MAILGLPQDLMRWDFPFLHGMGWVVNYSTRKKTKKRHKESMASINNKMHQQMKRAKELLMIRGATTIARQCNSFINSSF